jgi:sulfur carrier protein
LPVRVRIVGSQEARVVEYRPGMRVADVLRELGLLSNEYVVARNGRVVAEDEPVEDGDELVLYPVVSGG